MKGVKRRGENHLVRSVEPRIQQVLLHLWNPVSHGVVGAAWNVSEMLRHEPAVCELLRTMRSTAKVGPEETMARLNRGRCLLPQVR